jgi:hypothetical protein
VSATNLEAYKNIRRSRVMVMELKAAVRILNLAMRGLKEFNHYTPIKELLPSIKDCATILDIHLQHHKRILEKTDKNE